MRDIVDGWGGWKARARVRMRERLESKRTRELAGRRRKWPRKPKRAIFRFEYREKTQTEGAFCLL